MLFKRFFWITLVVSLFGITLAQIIAASHPGQRDHNAGGKWDRWQRVETPVCIEKQLDCASMAVLSPLHIG